MRTPQTVGGRPDVTGVRAAIWGGLRPDRDRTGSAIPGVGYGVTVIVKVVELERMLRESPGNTVFRATFPTRVNRRMTP